MKIENTPIDLFWTDAMEERMMADEHERELRMLVAAGGTGGHIFPAIAVVEQLQQMLGDALNVEFIGSEDRMEATMIPQLGYPYTSMPITGFKGMMDPSTITLPFKVLKSERIARDVIKRFKPHVVLVTGAYMSYPAGMAAYKERIPLVLMESNVNPGKTNARLSTYANAIILAFEESRDHFGDTQQDHLFVRGNPVRTQIKTDGDQRTARSTFGLQEERPTVFVFGGSLGARSLNQAVQDRVERWAATKATPDYQILWQTGKNFSATIPADIASHVVAHPFINDMGSAFAAADVVVCRSGATTIAELGIVGKPAILIPLPSASTNEQRLNAEVVERRGGAIVIKDDDVSATLMDTVQALLVDPSRRERMREAMLTIGKPDAASEAARIVLMAAGRVKKEVEA